MQLEAASNAREQEIEGAVDEYHVELRRPVAYTAASSSMTACAKSSPLYPKLTRRLRAAGRAAETFVRAASEGQSLRQDLRDEFTVSHSDSPDELSGSAMIAEFTKVTTPQGPASRIHGANFAETDVTQLPGLPSPAEIHGRPCPPTLEDLDVVLAGQVDLAEETVNRQVYNAALPDGDIDLRQRDQRLKVWKAVFARLAPRAGRRRRRWPP